MNNEFGILALNQTLFNKAFIIGKGFEEGKQSYADETINDGWYVFVNGKSWGIMNIEEHMTKEFLEKQKRKESLLGKSRAWPGPGQGGGFGFDIKS